MSILPDPNDQARLTSPVGTYLSTGADGQANGPWGAAPGYNANSSWEFGQDSWAQPAPQVPVTPQVAPQATIGPKPQNWWDNVVGSIKDAFAPKAPQMYNEIGQPIEYEQHHIWEGQETVTYNPVAFDDRGNRYFYDETKQEYVRASTGAMDSPGNPLVGNDLAAARNGEPPTRVSLQGALSIYKGYSMPDIVKLMELDGYTYNGNGFVKTGESATLEELQAAVTEIAGGGTAVSPEVDDRGRPLWVDAAALAEGERVTAASGVTYVGGQQYTNPAGQTVGQYAITLPGEGDRWAYKIKQDSDGNWVRIYYQKNLRSQASINRRRRRAAEQASEAPQQIPGQTGSTLVNLRADYG